MSLFSFNDNLLALHQIDNLSNSAFTVDIRVRMHLFEYNRLVSSAKIMNCNKFEQLTTSFMYKIKSKGPNIEPCGTTHETGLKLEDMLFNRTNCFLPDK